MGGEGGEETREVGSRINDSVKPKTLLKVQLTSKCSDSYSSSAVAHG